MNKSSFVFIVVGLCSLALKPGVLPSPDDGQLLIRDTVDGGSVEIIQVPKRIRPFVPAYFFIREAEPVAGALFNRLEDVLITNKDPKFGRAVTPRLHLIQQIGSHWGVVEKTFRVPGKHTLELFVRGQDGQEGQSIKIFFFVEPNAYLGFTQEFGLFAVGTVVLGLFLFWMAGKLKASSGRPVA